MTCSIHTLSRALFACAVFISLTSGLRAQTNTYGPPGQNWPDNPPVGIGTVGSGSPQNALQIHHGSAPTWPAILRLSDGATDSINIYGALALIPDTSLAFDSAWSSLATKHDLVLHEHIGDIILADFDPQPSAIRMSTTPDPTTIPAGTVNDLERETILNNGNIGFDLPPSTGGLCAPLDQIQFGGGTVPPAGYPSPVPGLTAYGGNRFEGMLLPSGKTAPVDYRYITLNHYQYHLTDTGGGRFAPLGASGIFFSPDDTNGLIQFEAVPFWTGDSLTDWSGGMTLSIGGREGLGFYCDERRFGGNQYDHLFDIYPPGVLPYGVTRNVNGLAFIRTPLCITASGSVTSPDFTNFTRVCPDIGDGQTWDLAVDRPVLAKEVFVLDSTWADYVFDLNFKLTPLDEAVNFMMQNHHLPDLPPASQLQKTGVPIERTEAALTKQLEEAMLYIGQLNDKVKKLESEVEELKNQKGK